MIVHRRVSVDCLKKAMGSFILNTCEENTLNMETDSHKIIKALMRARVCVCVCVEGGMSFNWGP